jgi:hypothetical protein
MNNLVQVAQPKSVFTVRSSGLKSGRMLLELLALNEEMILQLRRERMEVAGTTDFLNGLISQHEQIAATLREQLAIHWRP